MAFGRILDGPDPRRLTQLVQEAIPMLANIMLSNSNVGQTQHFLLFQQTFGKKLNLLEYSSCSCVQRRYGRSDVLWNSAQQS